MATTVSGTLTIPNEPRPRAFLIRVAQVGLSLAIVSFVFIGVLPRLTDYSAAWSSVKGVSWLAFVALLGVAALHLFMYWPQLAASLPGLTIAQAAVSNQTSTTVANTVPGGGLFAVGVSYRMYRAWGFGNAAIALSTMVTFVWNVFAKLGLPLIALIVLAVAGRATGAVLIATLAGLGVLGAAVGVLALMLWTDGPARRISAALGAVRNSWCRIVHRSPTSGLKEAGPRFRADAIKLVLERWRPLTLFTLATNLAMFLVLLIALRSVGVRGSELNWTQTLWVFAVVRLLSAFPITPGGVGFVELGYIGGLVLAAGPHPDVPAAQFHAQVAAAVLIFRVLTYALPIPVGAFTYLVWRRKMGWRAARPPVPAVAGPRPQPVLALP